MRAIPLSVLMVLAMLGAAPAAAGEEDPLKSVNWEGVREFAFGSAPVVFDDAHVLIDVPRKVEDGGQVPVAVRVRGLDEVREIVVLADLNPAPRAVVFHPLLAEPRLALRIKVNEATAVRAAALTADGVWHVAGGLVDAPGGGCTTASASQSTQSWKTRLNHVQGQAWSRPDGGDRLRLRIIHPMNTGFVDNIPAFFIDRLVVKTADGRIVTEMAPAEPMAENPTITVDLTKAGSSAAGYVVEWSDTDGNHGSASITPARQTLAAEAGR